MKVEMVFACACLVDEVGERDAHNLCIPVAQGEDPDYSRVQVTVKRDHSSIVAVCHFRPALDALRVSTGLEYYLPCIDIGPVLVVKGPQVN